AWKPDRARGMHALVGAAAVLLVITAAIDLAHGRTDFGDEAPHLLAVAGWLLLGRLAAATPSPAAAVGRSRPLGGGPLGAGGRRARAGMAARAASGVARAATEEARRAG